MPWKYVGNASSGRRKAAKKSQSGGGRSRIGRRLLNAGIADMLREERELEAAAAAAAAAAVRSNMPKKTSAGTTVNVSTKKTTSKVKTPTARGSTKIVPVAAPSVSNSSCPSKLLISANSNPRALDFLNFIFRLPPTDPTWRNDNGVGTMHTPSGLSKHIRDSTLVFSFKTLTSPEGGTTSRKPIFVLGATMHRRNNRKASTPLERQCQAVIHIQESKIINKWTDWEPNADRTRMCPGMFVWMIRDFLSVKKIEKSKICVLINEQDLHKKDSVCGLDWRHDFTHYVFQNNEYFPSVSGW